MGRSEKTLLVALFLLTTLLFFCAAAVFLIARGNPVSFIQTELIRLSLNARTADLERIAGFDSTPTRFVIESGQTPRVIAARLHEAALILDPDLFVDYVRVYRLDVELEAGIYFLNQTQTIPEIARVLTDSRGSFIPFRILEGWRIEEIAGAIDNNRLFSFSGADFLAVAGAGTPQDEAFSAAVGLPPGASLEGFLFPDTYQLPPDITPEGLRQTLTDRFLEVTGPELNQAAADQGYTLHEMVTLASIIERESVHADENPRFSSVYRTRLDIGMKLDADPTVQYGIGFQNGAWWPQITQADYTNARHAYNTYLITGLPPGPIANPGISAIRAAIEPAQTGYYYFRAECGGSGYHTFAVTYQEHLANGCS